MSQRESFCFNFFHTKIRGPKFCHNNKTVVINFRHHETRNSCAPPSLLSPPLTQFQKQQKKRRPPLYVCQRESGSQIHTHDLFCMSLLTTKVESRASPVGRDSMGWNLRGAAMRARLNSAAQRYLSKDAPLSECPSAS